MRCRTVTTPTRDLVHCARPVVAPTVRAPLRRAPTFERTLLNTKNLLRHSLLIAALLAVPLAQAADMTRPDYQSAKSRISTELKSDDMAGDARSACVTAAKARYGKT
jgi:hypothetical protein